MAPASMELDTSSLKLQRADELHEDVRTASKRLALQLERCNFGSCGAAYRCFASPPLPSEISLWGDLYKSPSRIAVDLVMSQPSAMLPWTVIYDITVSFSHRGL